MNNQYVCGFLIYAKTKTEAQQMFETGKVEPKYVCHQPSVEPPLFYAVVILVTLMAYITGTLRKNLL